MHGPWTAPCIPGEVGLAWNSPPRRRPPRATGGDVGASIMESFEGPNFRQDRKASGELQLALIVGGGWRQGAPRETRCRADSESIESEKCSSRQRQSLQRRRATADSVEAAETSRDGWLWRVARRYLWSNSEHMTLLNFKLPFVARCTPYLHDVLLNEQHRPPVRPTSKPNRGQGKQTL